MSTLCCTVTIIQTATLRLLHRKKDRARAVPTTTNRYNRNISLTTSYFSSYLAENKSHLHFNDKQFNEVHGNYHCLLFNNRADILNITAAGTYSYHCGPNV